MQDGQSMNDNRAALADLCDEIRETYRRRVDLQRAEIRLTLQIKSIERRLGEGSEAFAAGLPFQEARAIIHPIRLAAERRVIEIAMTFPVYAAFWEPVNGLGALGLGMIIGETGDLSQYANPAKVWKRMGLAVIDGKSQRKAKGAEGIKQAYNPSRRAVMFVIGDSLIKKQNPYRDLYLERKEYEREKAPDQKLIVYHRRAQRYMEKRLLRELWKAWRDCAALPVEQAA